MPSTRASRRRGPANEAPARSQAQPTAPPVQPGPVRPGDGEVLVRMYGQGLGDCFLLAFPRAGTPAGARPVYVVIDCGVIGGTPDGPARMKQVVEDIKLTTLDPDLTRERGKPTGHIDVLAITHEHWDHLSGFVQAQEAWEQIQVDAIWTAWTEKDEPGLPDVLKKIVRRQQQALAEIANRAIRFGLDGDHETVLGLMSFLSDAASEGVPFGATAGTGDAFDIAKGLAGSHVFCEPGEVRRVPGTTTDAYVLGPPRNDARLRQMDPTKRAPETFEGPEAVARAGTTPAAGLQVVAGTGAQPVAGTGGQPPASTGGQPVAGTGAQPAAGLGFAPPDPSISLRSLVEGRSTFNAFALPLLQSARALAEAAPQYGPADAAADRDAFDGTFPFDPAVRVALPVAEEVAGSATMPDGTPAYPALASYFDELNCWRRIDFDWLAGSEAFALQADSLTNNTCLVLAFELPPSPGSGERKVLLFVGDAQVGNWLSWDEIERWHPIDDAAPSQRGAPNIADLLGRAAFYKVGHHGSHNATLKARGVERMRADRTLTAFVPTSPPVARELKDWCQMPLDVLLDALAERTGNRVVLANGNVWPPLDDPQALAEARTRIGVTVSETTLPPKVRAKDGTTIEGAVPLWVQMAIAY